MKKGRSILCLICAISFGLIIGIFWGRNMPTKYVQFPESDAYFATESRNQIDYRIDLNTATKAQLMELPGIGETLADRIVEYRARNGAFLTTKDLLNVSGIGEGKLKEIEERIKIGE